MFYKRIIIRLSCILSCIFVLSMFGVSARAESDCCYEHPGLGCDNDGCQECVCYGFGFFECCNFSWDASCVLIASHECSDFCPTPCGTIVQLTEFIAFASKGGVTLEWETASEIDNAGFHLWRSDTEDGDYTRITPTLIPAQGGPTFGATYTYEDCDVKPGLTYYYQLEDIDCDGVSTFHGPVTATADGAEIVLMSPEDGTSVSFFRSPVFDWESADLVRFKLVFSTSPDFTGKVIVLPQGSERNGAWITGESYFPNRMEWRKIQRLGRRGGSVYWAVFGENEAGEGFVSKTFELKIEN